MVTMGSLRATSWLRLVSILLGVQGLFISAAASTAMALTLTSPAFRQGAAIPSRFTCEGDNVSPPLAFEGVPAGANSLALIIDDPDAPDPKAPKHVWVHWVVLNLPADAAGVGENASAVGLPAGAIQGINDYKNRGFDGPCPPIGRHRYFHKLYALDVRLPAKALTKTELEAAMDGHVLAKAEFIGTYQKGNR
jgi:hypothetical protein